MSKPITVFLPYNHNDFTLQTIDAFNASGLADRIFLMSNTPTGVDKPNTQDLITDAPLSSQTFRKIGEVARTEYIALLTKDRYAD